MMPAPSSLRAALRWNLRSPFQRRPQSSKPPKTPIAEDAIPVPSTVAPLPLWQRLGPLTRAAEGYARAQRTRPYRTQLASAIFIFTAADVSAQTMGGNEYDPLKSGRSMIIGAIAAIPQYRWFFFLARNFNYASRVLSIGTKVIVSQLLFTPIFNSYFFGAQALLSGDGIQGTIDRVKRTVPVSFVNSWKLWPAVTVVALTCVPLEYRAIFTGFIAIGWQTYLAFLNRDAEVLEMAMAEQNSAVAATVLAENANASEF